MADEGIRRTGMTCTVHQDRGGDLGMLLPAMRSDLDLDFGRPAAVRPPNLIVGSGWWRPRGGDRRHSGIDLNMPEGTPILAVADGEVGWVQLDPNSGAGGIWLGLRHAKGWVSRYMHLSRVAVQRGQRVTKGQIIGYSGDTGTSSTPHLHFDLKLPAAMIPVLEQYLPKPKTGYLEDQPPYGVGVPAEPWIPVDGYWDRTRAEARKHGILLYSERLRRDDAARQRSPRVTSSIGAVVGVLAMGVATAAIFVTLVRRPAPVRGLHEAGQRR